MNLTLFLADSISAVHLLYVSIVVFGQLAIMLGWALNWRWVRNPWFRITHLVMILIVAVEATVDFECPLTTWEISLRRLAEPEAAKQLNSWDLQERSFTGRLVRSLMFFDDSWGDVLTYGYYSVAFLVLATVFLVPPRFGRRSAAPPAHRAYTASFNTSAPLAPAAPAVVATPVIAAPVIAAPVIAAPVIAAPVMPVATTSTATPSTAKR